MNRSALLSLLTRYQANQCTPEECQLVEQWYELLGEPFEIPLTEQQWLILEQKLWRQVQPKVYEKDTNPAPTGRSLWRRIGWMASSVAAVVLIVIGVNWYLAQIPGTFATRAFIEKAEQSEWTKHENQSSNNKQIILSDGSIVVLLPNAQLAVHRAFNMENRDVRLLGEANFEVQRNPNRPFLVYSGDIVTEVLGTAFQIRAGNTNLPIQVAVQSGKVTVYRQFIEDPSKVTPNRGVILTPNQKATYFPENKQFVTEITEDPQPISEKESAPSLQFVDESLGEVIRQLEILYGTDIELEQESLSQCPFTGNITSQPLFTKLELLCGTINGSYEVRGTKILITGKGCY